MKSLVEILGEDDFGRVAAQLPPEAEFPLGEVHTALDRLFGEVSAAGIMLRAGRASFTQILKDLGVEAGFTATEFKLLPMKKKVPRGLQLLADLISPVTGQQISVEARPTDYLWRVSQCLDCRHPHRTDLPACTYYSGLLQEYMAWMAAGKVFLVDEIECCLGGGDECVFKVARSAIE